MGFDMPELPWRKWYPQDWKGDPQLSRCSAATRGIWADAISCMMQQQTFKIEGTDDELARDCRCFPAEIQAAHDELKRTKTAEVNMQNGCKTWVCRRLKREHEISAYRRNAALAMHSKHHANTLQHVDANTLQPEDAKAHARSASVSVSVSASVPTSAPSIGDRLIKLFGRNGSTQMSYIEQTSIFEISKRPDALKEVSEIEVFHQREKKYFPKSLSSLVTQWDKYLDQARVWKPHRTPEQEREYQNVLKSI
jgi:hypothetical protein